MGYCQGMNYIAAIILINVKDEEKSFWVLVYLMQTLKWNEVFSDNTPRVIKIIKEIHKLLDKNINDLMLHIEENDVSFVPKNKNIDPS